jgi:topoisomerase IV subunit A
VKGKEKDSEKHEVEELISIKGIKAIGNRLTRDKVKMINLLDPIPFEDPEETVEAKDDTEEPGEKQGSLGFE